MRTRLRESETIVMISKKHPLNIILMVTVAIVLVVWALLSLLNRHRPSVARYARTLTAAACTSIAVVWTGERVLAVVRATFG